MIKKLVVDVTEEDIREGSPRMAAHCPVSLAVSRCLGSVGFPTDLQVVVGKNRVRTLTGKVYAWLPGETERAIRRYDDSGKMAPFTFEVELNIDQTIAAEYGIKEDGK